MRILLLSDFYPPVRGGLEFHVDALAGELSSRGHIVQVATMTPSAAASNPEVRVHTIDSFSRHLPHSDSDRPFTVPMSDARARRQLSAVIDAFGPDVVHGHSWLAASLPTHLSAPLVLTAHDYGLVCEIRTLLRPDGRICEGPGVAKCLGCARKTYGLAKAALLEGATWCGRQQIRPAAVIAVSGAVRDAIAPYLSVPVEVISNFAVEIEPAAWVRPFDPALPFAMYAGDPGAHKGTAVLLEAWQGRTGSAAQLLLALTKPWPGRLPAGVHALQLARAQVAAAWRDATVAVVPSLWPDPCPTVALEALAAGTPVVASNVGGLPDLVRDGVDGYLVKPGSAVELQDRLDALLDGHELRSSMSAAALLGSSRFAPGAVVDRIEAVYRRVLGHSPSDADRPVDLTDAKAATRGVLR